MKCLPIDGTQYSSHKKLDWVRRRVIYLAVHMPHAGCRTIANTFNRWHSCVSVGKTWVAELMKTHAVEIAAQRRAMRSQSAKTIEAGHWALDLSYWRNADGKLLTLLGIIDQRSRRALCLRQLPSKCVLTLLGFLFLTMAKFGIPKSVRTDNEAMFTSRLWSLTLKLFRIQAKRGPPAQPWRNGRIERLFGSLKTLLRNINWTLMPNLDNALQAFSVFYNEMRPHQNLNGLTPLEAWQGKTLRDIQASHEPYRAQWLCALRQGTHHFPLRR